MSGLAFQHLGSAREAQHLISILEAAMPTATGRGGHVGQAQPLELPLVGEAAACVDLELHAASLATGPVTWGAWPEIRSRCLRKASESIRPKGIKNNILF